MSDLTDFMVRHGYVPIDGEVWHGFACGFYFKRMVMETGQKAFEHAHKADHAVLITKGKVLVRTSEDKDYILANVYTAPHALEIKAHVRHEIDALTPAEAWCIWDVKGLELDAKSSDEIDQALIEEG